MNINHNITERDIDKLDFISPLEHQIQQQDMKELGWRFDKTNSRTLYFYKIGEIIGRSYVKIPLKSSAILIIENDDKFCFLWSKLSLLHLCDVKHPNRVSNYRQYFNELNTERFYFFNGFKCSDVQKFEKLNISSRNEFDMNFYQDQIKKRHRLTPIEVSENESNRVVDLLFYKNHYALIRKIIVFQEIIMNILSVDAV